MVAETSIEAYTNLIPSLSARQREVLEVIAERGAVNNQEIADHLDIPAHFITGRVKELRDKGKIEIAFKAKYHGKTVQYHQVKR